MCAIETNCLKTHEVEHFNHGQHLSTFFAVGRRRGLASGLIVGIDRRFTGDQIVITGRWLGL